MRFSFQAGTFSPGTAFRTYMGGVAVLDWFLSTTEPQSILHQISETTDGRIVLALLALLGISAMVDAILNDFLPHKYCWRAGLKHRHFVLTGMAFCNIAQIYVAFYHVRATGFLLYCMWNALTLVCVAFVDAAQRSKDASCVIVCN